MNETGLNSNIPRQALQPRLTEAAHFGPEEEAVVDEVLRAQVQALEREPELEPEPELELEPEPEGRELMGLVCPLCHAHQKPSSKSMLVSSN